MSEENRNKRMANEHLIIDENEEKNQNKKSLKVAVISGSSNVGNLQENSVVLREDLSKVIIKVQNSPVRKPFFNELGEDMENDVSEKDNSIDIVEDKANVSQRIFDSLLVNRENLILKYFKDI